MAEFNTKLHKV